MRSVAKQGSRGQGQGPLYCIVFAPVLNPKSYDGARVLEASGRPITLYIANTATISYSRHQRGIAHRQIRSAR